MIRGLLSSIVISVAGLAYEPTDPAPSELTQVAPSELTQVAQAAQRQDAQVMTVAAQSELGEGYFRPSRPQSGGTLYLLRYLPMGLSGFLVVWALITLARQSNDEEGVE